jgi:hypothetical protein
MSLICRSKSVRAEVIVITFQAYTLASQAFHSA